MLAASSLKMAISRSSPYFRPAGIFTGPRVYKPAIPLNSRWDFYHTSNHIMSSFYELAPLDAKKEAYPFVELKGKVVLIVNVASKCGFTPQYTELEELNKKYASKGLQIIGFPCNQFASQEPGTAEEIGSFCQLNYGVTFPVLNKVDVNGDKADPVWKYLKSQKSGIFGLTRIKWNFEKFLVDKTGKVVQRYASTTKPKSLEAKIEELLK